MLNILPKFGAGAHDDVLHDVGEAPPPFHYPVIQTARSFSSRMILAASLATSTPFITEIPDVRGCAVTERR